MRTPRSKSARSARRAARHPGRLRVQKFSGSAQWLLNASLCELLRPVDGVDEDAQLVLAQAIGVARRLDHDGENGGPALGSSELAALEAALGPGHAETLRRCSNDARDLDGDLHLAELREWIVAAGIVVQRRGTAIGSELVGAQPALAQHDGVGRQAAHILDEASQVEGDLRI